MTPLAAKVANELTLPLKRRTFEDGGGVLDLFDQEMHCFEVSALSKSVNAVLDDPIAEGDEDASWSVWRDIESMLPRMFLPSPVTWLEMVVNGARIACVVREKGPYFSLSTVHQSNKGNFSLHMCDFRPRGILEHGDRIEVVWGDLAQLDVPDDPAVSRIVSETKGPITRERVNALRASRDLIEARASLLDRKVEMGNASVEVMQAGNRFIGMVVLTLDLINTPGLIGLKQREANRGLARALNRIGVGRYPLRAWSEVVLKHEARIAEPGERNDPYRDRSGGWRRGVRPAINLFGEELIAHQSQLPPGENKFHVGNGDDGKHYWLTPPELYAELDAEFHFDFDPCPYPLPDGFDGLTCEWGQSSYVNPPFGSIMHKGPGDRRAKKKGPTAWVRKAIEEWRKGKRVVLVYPVDKWVLMLLTAILGDHAQVRNLGDVKWLATEDGSAGKGTGRHIACFILEPAA